jgi:hypothetical protein
LASLMDEAERSTAMARGAAGRGAGREAWR